MCYAIQLAQKSTDFLGPGPRPATTLSGNRPLQSLTMAGSGAGVASIREQKKEKTGHTPTRFKRAKKSENTNAEPMQEQLPPLLPQTGMTVVGAAPGVDVDLEGSNSGALTGAGSTAMLGRGQRGKTATQVWIPGEFSIAQDDNYCSNLSHTQSGQG